MNKTPYPGGWYYDATPVQTSALGDGGWEGSSTRDQASGKS